MHSPMIHKMTHFGRRPGQTNGKYPLFKDEQVAGFILHKVECSGTDMIGKRKQGSVPGQVCYSY